MGFLDIASSVFTGGVTGIVGAAITRYADYKTAELNLKINDQNNKFHLDSKQIDAQIMKQEWEMRDKIAAVEAEGRSDVAAYGTLAASYSLEPKMYSDSSHYTKNQNWVMIALDFVRGVVRPGITAYAVILMTLMYWHIRGLPISVEAGNSAYLETVQNILYTCTSVIMWWFGSRAQKKK